MAELPGTYRALTPDLRGHGDRAHVRPVSLAAVLDDLVPLLPVDVLAGYSLGGRVALRLALAAPERVGRLVLVATSAGLADDERAARRVADEALATQAERLAPAAWADRWMATPLFAGTPPAAAAAWREELLRTPPVGAAAALRGLGAGTMPAVWDRLGELRMPCDVVVGARDARYRSLGERLAAALPDARLHVVPGAGHGLPREAPAALARLIAGDAAAQPRL